MFYYVMPAWRSDNANDWATYLHSRVTLTFDGVQVEQNLSDNDTDIDKNEHTKYDLEGTAVEQACCPLPPSVTRSHTLHTVSPCHHWGITPLLHCWRPM